MIEWRWGLEPMTLRDRYAKNFAEALDFTQRRLRRSIFRLTIHRRQGPAPLAAGGSSFKPRATAP